MVQFATLLSSLPNYYAEANLELVKLLNNIDSIIISVIDNKSQIEVNWLKAKLD